MSKINQMTFGELYTLVKSGKIVSVTTTYGNTRTYFLNEKGVMYDQFNRCAPTLTLGELNKDDKSTLSSLSTIRVFDTYNFQTGEYGEQLDKSNYKT